MMVGKATNIVITGVGGQGVITAANILGKAAVKANVYVITSEVHGMAQRGGTVNCMVRMGDVASPLVPNGSADVILSLEPVEALRYITYAHKKTKIITDVSPVVPFTVAVGGEKYPTLDEIYAEIKRFGCLYTVDALRIARDSGAVIAKNTVMLGALAAADVLPFSSAILLDTILEAVPERYKDVNRKAFEGGMKAYSEDKSSV